MAAAHSSPKLIPPSPSEQLWEEAGWLPCVFSVDLPLKTFTVRSLLRLEPGSLIESTLSDGSDVPVAVNSQVIGWGEFEAVDQRLAVRITEVK